MNRILGSVMVIGLTIMLAGVGTLAEFSDTEKSEGNTFAAGAIDLHIDWTESYNGVIIEEKAMGDLTGEPIFSADNGLGDLKPGDNGEATISIHVENNPALLWIILDNIADNENGLTEPENELGDTGPEGELSEYMKFALWVDCNGNNIKEPGEPFICEEGTAEDGSLGPVIIENCTVYYLGVKWWIPWDVGNIIQSDSLSGDIVFYVEQLRNNPAAEGAIEVPPCEVF